MPRDEFNAARYEGSDGDERRLFYVAMTRARDWLSVSRHDARDQAGCPGRARTTWSWPSFEVEPEDVAACLRSSRATADDEPIAMTYSELALFIDCGLAFRLRNLIGFEPRIAPELGYGKAVHHVMRTVAETTRRYGPGSRRRPRSTRSSTTASSCRVRTSRRTAS